MNELPLETELEVSVARANLELAEKYKLQQPERFFAAYAANILEHLRRAPAIDKNDFHQFVAAVAPYAHKAKGQLFQDLWAWWESGFKRNGFFVEFGAASGVHLSNTYFLEKEAGWNGIVAEPNPRFWRSIETNRSCIRSSKCVYSRTGESIAFILARYGEISRIAEIAPDDPHERRGARQDQSEEVTVDTISLHDLLIEAGAPTDIDYMSVDTEGSEYEILAAFPFSKWNVRSLNVEHNHTAAREQLHELLTKNGFIRKWTEFSRFDDWYVSNA